MPGEPDRHEIRIEVKESDIDMMGHVNNVVFLRWVQEAATAHWFAAASPADQEALLWVVLRHEIDYKHPALLETKSWLIRGWEPHRVVPSSATPSCHVHRTVGC